MSTTRSFDLSASLPRSVACRIAAVFPSIARLAMSPLYQLRRGQSWSR
ncbi:hypothetical protein [Vibrio nigripulchritudo]|nr:hypothetical protein [Vibrio nigripulchritudo]